MATCQALINRALRLIGELQSGRNPPANEAADALEALKDLYKHLVATGALGRLTDVLATANYTAGENERVVNGSGGAITITLPTTITDRNTYGPVPAGATYDYGFCQPGNGIRPPRDRAVVVKAGATPETWIYDADLAAWVQIDNLALADQAPFTQKLKTGMASLLAAHLAPEYGDAPVTSAVAVGAGQCMSALSNRADSPATLTAGEFF